MARVLYGVCGLHPQLRGRKRGNICRWPRGQTVRWTLLDRVSPLDKASTRAVFTAAWQAWEAACGLRAERVETVADANCVIGTEAIDGSGDVLAWAELPCGSPGRDTQLDSRFDAGERWCDCKDMPRGQIDLYRVAVHEIGHLIGIGHNEDGETNAIMDPAISDLYELQPWDVDQAVRRYGPPDGEPEPDPDCPLEDCLDLIRKIKERW